MGMFSDLMQKIFHHGAEAEHPYDAAPAAPGGGVTMPAPRGTTATATATASQVDVAATLDRMAASNSQKLDWKHSIVDLMKLVGMDSGLDARKELARDLNYTGDTNDSAAMNIWLHKEVMKKLAANGGKVPPELLAH